MLVSKRQPASTASWPVAGVGCGPRRSPQKNKHGFLRRGIFRDKAEQNLMAHQGFWMVQHRVLYLSMSDDVILDDFRGISRLAADKLEEVSAHAPNNLVIGIVDLRAAKLVQMMRRVVSAAVQNIAEVIDPRIWKAKPGFVVIITTSDSAKMMTALVIRLYAQPMTSVGTLDEAITVVGSMFPELTAQMDAYRDKDPLINPNTP